MLCQFLLEKYSKAHKTPIPNNHFEYFNSGESKLVSVNALL